MTTLGVSMDADRTVLVRQGAPARPALGSSAASTRPASSTRPVPRTGAAVAGPNAACTEAGSEVAERGGNAVDVAIAAVITALVNEPGVASLGGGAYLTVAPAGGGAAVTVDGSVAMPGKGLPAGAFGQGLRTVEMVYGGGVRMEAGHGSVATPGALTAFELAQARYGRLPWATVVAPAARVARDGFPLGRTAANYLGFALDPLFGQDREAVAAMTGPHGRRLVAGDVVRMPQLADFLDLVARDGAAALHRGEVAHRLATAMAEHGGLVTEADLAGYRPVERPALQVRAGRWRWATNPPPSVGGSVLAAMLLLFQELLGAQEPVGVDPAGLARMIDVQRAVLSYRVREMDLAPDRQRAAARLIDAIDGKGLRWLPTSPSTVHVSAVDGDGTACSVTASSGYGAGVSVPGTGVWLNNCLGERELNRRGVHALPPGERVVSNMSPTVGVHDDGTVLAIGSPGADRIASAIAQVVLALVGGASPAAAIDVPRVHVTCADDGRPVWVEHEADVVRVAGVATDLPWREHPRQSMFFGGVAVAARTATGLLEAAADPRREGSVAVVS